MVRVHVPRGDIRYLMDWLSTIQKEVERIGPIPIHHDRLVRCYILFFKGLAVERYPFIDLSYLYLQAFDLQLFKLISGLFLVFRMEHHLWSPLLVSLL